MSWFEAAAVMKDGLRAYTALHVLARMAAGQTLLVLDGASVSISSDCSHSLITVSCVIEVLKIDFPFMDLLYCMHAAVWGSDHSARPLSWCESPGYSFVSWRPEVFGGAQAECGWAFNWFFVEKNDGDDVFPMQCEFCIKFNLAFYTEKLIW